MVAREVVMHCLMPSRLSELGSRGRTSRTWASLLCPSGVRPEFPWCVWGWQQEALEGWLVGGLVLWGSCSLPHLRALAWDEVGETGAGGDVKRRKGGVGKESIPMGLEFFRQFWAGKNRAWGERVPRRVQRK